MDKTKRAYAHDLSSCAVFSLIAASLQLFPVFFPLLGLLMSPVSTLPVCICIIKNRYLGFLGYPCAFLLIFLFSAHEALIFLCTTGLLGFTIGLCFARKVGLLNTAVFAGIILFLGISIMTGFLGLPAFGDLTAGQSYSFLLPFYLLFSLVWSVIWTITINMHLSLILKD